MFTTTPSFSIFMPVVDASSDLSRVIGDDTWLADVIMSDFSYIGVGSVPWYYGYLIIISVGRR